MSFVKHTLDHWISFPRPNKQARLRLFCFPYAGGSISIFNNWANYLPSEVELCLVKLPGRESRLREPPMTRLQPLVETIAEVLASYLDKPFALFGHSLGALICFELACQLRLQKSPTPVHLFVSACRAPQILNPNPPIHELPLPEFIEALRQYNGTPDEILENSEIMELLLPILRADFAVFETYAYSIQKPLNCAISAFGGTDDQDINREDIVAWKNQTLQSFSFQMFTSNHFFLHNQRSQLLAFIFQDLKPFLI